MTLAIIGLAIGLASIWGAAYLLRIWHEDRDDRLANDLAVAARAAEAKAASWPRRWWLSFMAPGWPLSRVIAYIAVACTVASNYLGFLTLSRLLNIQVEGLTNEQLRIALTPFTITFLLVLDVAFVVLAAYLRLVRAGRIAE